MKEADGSSEGSMGTATDGSPVMKLSTSGIEAVADADERTKGDSSIETQPFDLSSPRMSRIISVSGTSAPAFMRASALIPAAHHDKHPSLTSNKQIYPYQEGFDSAHFVVANLPS